MATFTVELTLNRPARQRFRKSFDKGIVVELEKDQALLRVKGLEAETPEEAIGRAFDLANRVLDAIALDHGLPLVVLESPWKVEFRNSNGKSIPHVFASDSLTLVDECVQITIRKANGTVEIHRPADEPIEVRLSESDCARFYRGGLVAESRQSWFEAMREYFRAIECVSTAIEGHWNGVDTIARVLGEYCSDSQRSERLRQVAEQCLRCTFQPPDLASAVADYLYHSQRCELAHAQALAGKSYKKPFDRKDEEMVRDALPLARFVAAELIKMHSDKLRPGPRRREA